MLKSNSTQFESPVVDLGALSRTFWRGRLVIAACLAVAIPLGLAAAFSAETYYRSSTLLFIAPSNQQLGLSPQLSQAPSASGNAMEEVTNELRVLSTRQVFERAIDDLALMEEPRLSALLPSAPEGPFAIFQGDQNAEPMTEEAQRRAIVRALRHATTISQRGLSRVVEIDVSLSDPDLTAGVANAIAEAYVSIKVEEARADIRDAAEWLSGQVVELQSRAQTSAAAVEAFRASTGMADTSLIDGLAIQLNQLNENLAAARQDRARLEVDLETAPEDDGAREGLERALENATARQAALEASIVDVSARVEVQSQTAIELAQLEQQATADRFIYERFLEQSRQNYALESLPQIGTRVLEEAQVPFEPAGPSKPLILGLAIFLGGFIGVGFVFLTEFLRAGVRSREELAEITRLPVVASLPTVPRKRAYTRRGVRRARQANAEFNEELRGFRNTILPPQGEPGRVVALTSSVPNEGKTTVSLALAQLTMAGNRRAVVVDCDQRRSRMADALDLPHEDSLEDVLSGKSRVV
ncbi:MAG: exopolysaccharide transport family protein, partial [Pseudomonadota bacterium]